MSKPIDVTAAPKEKKELDRLILRWLWGFLRPYRFGIGITIFFMLLGKGIESWIPIALGQLVQYFFSNSHSMDLKNHALVNDVTILLLAIASCFILDLFVNVLKNWIGQESIYRLRNSVYDHLLKMPLHVYDSQPIGRLMTRTIHDVDQINQLFTESLIPLITSLFLFLGMMMGAFFLSWQIGLFLLLIFPLGAWLVHDFRNQQRESYLKIRQIVSAMNGFIQEHLMGIVLIRNFDLVEEESERFDRLNRDHFNENVETIKQFSFFFSSIEWMQTVLLVGVFVILIKTMPSGAPFNAGTYFTISLYGMMLFRPMADLAERYNLLQSALAASENVYKILQTTMEDDRRSDPIPLSGIDEIRFENVWFAYTEEHWVLKDVSFTLKKGESLALVGPTGAGKSSIVSLLLRFYDYQKGRILINGQEIEQYLLADLRKQFSVILQDPVIFSGSLEENIGFYDRSISTQRINESLAYVGLSVLLDREHQGLKTKLKERGVSLSAGEMQLVSMARAVSHQRSVLLFDEATSNIDVKTERQIQETLKKVLKNQTALIIAHRLSTVHDVSCILVLQNGFIIERGSHEQLLLRKGVYEKLHRLQFASAEV